MVFCCLAGVGKLCAAQQTIEYDEKLKIDVMFVFNILENQL